MKSRDRLAGGVARPLLGPRPMGPHPTDADDDTLVLTAHVRELRALLERCRDDDAPSVPPPLPAKLASVQRSLEPDDSWLQRLPPEARAVLLEAQRGTIEKSAAVVWPITA